MDLDLQVFKALSTETRLRMLKILSLRKKMPSELQKDLKLSSSTIIEHLKILKDAGLIRRIDTDHKWVYYALTEKGENIVGSNNTQIKFILTLIIGLVMATSSAFTLYARTTYVVFDNAIMDENISDMIQESLSSEIAKQAVPIDWVSFLVLVTGLFLIVFSLYKILKRKNHLLHKSPLK